MRVSRLFVAAFAVAAALSAATPAFARDIRVSLDQAFPIRLSEPAEGVAVGNPSIAGVSVQNDQFLFVTGRSYGSTNLVVVGEGGRVLYSGRIVVAPDETDVVMVTRGVETARLECTPLCRPRPDIGDGPASTSVNEQIASRPAAASR
jgi:Flp pilus assembly secretin CpaC